MPPECILSKVNWYVVQASIEDEKELVWVGLVGLQDPPRAQVMPALEVCQQAAIRVVMVTGDNSATAESIAKQASSCSSLSPGLAKRLITCTQQLE